MPEKCPRWLSTGMRNEGRRRCPSCQARIGEHVLRRHMAACDGYDGLDCRKCGKEFRRLTHRRRHEEMCKRTPQPKLIKGLQRIYRCSGCHRRTNRAVWYQKHIEKCAKFKNLQARTPKIAPRDK